ncbi:MAG: 4-phosphoerythronate dehydrogenase [Sedimentisphaerales bacterium]|nr:4-phosphoerythronate dehydrogenase [Sedimentisphaerales bacterium]
MKIVADENIPFVKECFSSMGDVITVSGRQINPGTVKDADILLVRSITKVDAELLAGSNVKFVATATIGTDHINEDYLSKNNIGFTYAPGSNSNSVAEYVVAALLALGKKHKFRLEGKSIGIIGVGNVGSKVAKKTAALGMKVILNDPPLERDTKNNRYRPLGELLGCDFITVHTPLTRQGQDKTYHLADDKFFNSLANKPFFINTARGGCCDTTALKSALDAGKISGAVLDVWENEPLIDNQMILKAELSTPHIAGYSFDGKVNGMIMIYDAACQHFGLTSKFTAKDFLPAPDITVINIDSGSDDQQMIMHDTVQQIYAINRDDFNTREILIVPEDQKGGWFDDLRKNYPIRREFQNTKIILAKQDGRLAEKIKGIGFSIE